MLYCGRLVEEATSCVRLRDHDGSCDDGSCVRTDPDDAEIVVWRRLRDILTKAIPGQSKSDDEELMLLMFVSARWTDFPKIGKERIKLK